MFKAFSLWFITQLDEIHLSWVGKACLFASLFEGLLGKVSQRPCTEGKPFAITSPLMCQFSFSPWSRVGRSLKLCLDCNSSFLSLLLWVCSLKPTFWITVYDEEIKCSTWGWGISPHFKWLSLPTNTVCIAGLGTELFDTSAWGEALGCTFMGTVPTVDASAQGFITANAWSLPSWGPHWCAAWPCTFHMDCTLVLLFYSEGKWCCLEKKGGKITIYSAYTFCAGSNQFQFRIVYIRAQMQVI